MSSIRIRSQAVGGETEVRVLISHPMENGRNRDTLGGELIPAHFIEELSILVNGTEAIRVDMAGSISKNPFFTFRLRNLAPGDKIGAIWLDNRQMRDSAEHVIG